MRQVRRCSSRNGRVDLQRPRHPRRGQRKRRTSGLQRQRRSRVPRCSARAPPQASQRTALEAWLLQAICRSHATVAGCHCLTPWDLLRDARVLKSYRFCIISSDFNFLKSSSISWQTDCCLSPRVGFLLFVPCPNETTWVSYGLPERDVACRKNDGDLKKFKSIKRNQKPTKSLLRARDSGSELRTQALKDGGFDRSVQRLNAASNN